jgi:hypothetical protein
MLICDGKKYIFIFTYEHVNPILFDSLGSQDVGLSHSSSALWEKIPQPQDLKCDLSLGVLLSKICIDAMHD